MENILEQENLPYISNSSLISNAYNQLCPNAPHIRPVPCNINEIPILELPASANYSNLSINPNELETETSENESII